MAITLLVLFFILAVLGRVTLHYKLTGDHGIRPAKIDSPLIIKVSSFLFLASFTVISILVISDALALFEPPKFDGIKMPILGGLLSVSGILITVISQYQMGSSWRFGIDDTEKTILITRGVYAFVRNPIYTGVNVFCIGLLLILPSIYMLTVCLMLILSIETYVRFGEEPYLYKIHGNKFQDYMRKTGRYFPSL